MTDTKPTPTNTRPTSTAPTTTTIIVAKTEKSVTAAFFLTFLFGPLGLLYASIAGGIIMIILAMIVIPLTLGLGFLLIWPASMIWAVIAAMVSKSDKNTEKTADGTKGSK